MWCVGERRTHGERETGEGERKERGKERKKEKTEREREGDWGRDRQRQIVSLRDRELINNNVLGPLVFFSVWQYNKDYWGIPQPLRVWIPLMCRPAAVLMIPQVDHVDCFMDLAVLSRTCLPSYEHIRHTMCHTDNCSHSNHTSPHGFVHYRFTGFNCFHTSTTTAPLHVI